MTEIIRPNSLDEEIPLEAAMGVLRRVEWSNLMIDF